jgi:hypothetical protein
MQRQPVSFRIFEDGHITDLRRDLCFGDEHIPAGGGDSVEHRSPHFHLFFIVLWHILQ